ncbi:carbohydrate-binding protein [Saccharicrinis sp. 156]|uniref:carbohydrate-binding protein n=1 Tax=Saccharicrinis sp. 156 TaxID=3417574 RepID=UPI003D342290
MTNFTKFTLIAYFLILLSNGLFGQKSYYVSVNEGSDENNGTSLTSPFATLQKAADMVQAGETVYIREGVYREQVNLTSSGLEGQPIIFTPYNEEQVTITTTNLLSGWTQNDGNIYKTTFDSNVTPRNKMTVFIDGLWVNEAHWSSVGKNVDLLDIDKYSPVDSYSSNTISDSDLMGFPNDYWKDAYIWIQVNDWSIWPRKITGFNGSTGTITVDGSLDVNLDKYKYLILDSYHALDSAGEWYFDDDNNELYLWCPNDADPNTVSVEVKVRENCFELNGNDYINFEGIDFRGGDINMAGSNHILLTGAHIYVPDWDFGMDSDFDITSLNIDGSNNIIRDNEIEGVCGQFITLSGANNSIINNYFHRLGYNNADGAGVALKKCDTGNLISHNTFTEVGHSVISSVGGAYQLIIQYNEFSNTCMLTADVGAVGFGNSSFNNSIVHHNVFHDMANMSAGFYMDFMGSDITVHHNIFYGGHYWGMKINIPATNIFFFNNTVFQPGTIHSSSVSDESEAQNVRIYNNIYSDAHEVLINSGAEFEGNYLTQSGSNFTDVSTGDFTLIQGSNAIDCGIEIEGITDSFNGAAPDAGAVEFGEQMWEYGHDFNSLPNPSYYWYEIPFSNFISNPSFESDLNYWTTNQGDPKAIYGNSWNYKEQALATNGYNALELQNGHEIEQYISGLKPNTNYKFTAKARVLSEDIQIESHTSYSGSFDKAHYGNEFSYGDLNNGEWLCFDNVNFGTDEALYNTIEIGVNRNSEIEIEIRLDNLNGDLLTTFDIQGGTEITWNMSSAKIPSVIGTHKVYLIIKDCTNTSSRIDRIRLLNTNLSERVKLSVKDYDNNKIITEEIGYAYWTGEEGLVFKTGSASNSATIILEKEKGNLNGYIDNVSLIQTSTAQSSIMPHKIPGIIFLENYDEGGQGIAYNVINTSEANIRSSKDKVGIEPMDESNEVNYISDLKRGEWLEYTISTVESGLYNIDLKCINNVVDTCNIILTLNNLELGKFVLAPKEDSYEWETIRLTDINIDERYDQVLRLQVLDGSLQLNHLNFSKIPGINITKCFPTPTRDLFAIVFTCKEVASIPINVYNEMGQLVLTEQIVSKEGTNKAVLNLSGLETGLYKIVLNYDNSDIIINTSKIAFIP